MIRKDMTIEEVLRLYPKTANVFREFGLECMECQIAALEKLEHGARVHDIDVETLLAELNRAIEK